MANSTPINPAFFSSSATTGGGNFLWSKGNAATTLSTTVPTVFIGGLSLPHGTVLSGVSINNVNGTIHVQPQAPSPPRGWNRFLGASELLEEFARIASGRGMGREDFLNLPIKYFIRWLVLEAAAADGIDPPPGMVETPLSLAHRCRACGRFLPQAFRRLEVNHCNPAHVEITLARRALLPAA